MEKLDKYEYNLKLEEIDKLVDQGDYKAAAEMADSIDWRRVRNIRTLCLISEIYEASGRLEDSKNILIRAYRRSPVGRTVLYRLIEVTTELQQYDEAIEYYTEYVQAAPHDNNRYILKYKIYKGRGSSIEELIAILEEYLGQEYTEKWAYELAKLYQQSGQMQKCLAACDDLVLWFHSGKYVAKALELKKRYAALTPKQQQIYEECLEERMEESLTSEEQEEDNVIQKVESTDGEVIAESIMAETEKEIADQVTAHKAELEKEPEEETPEIEKTRQYVKPGSKIQESAAEDSKNLQVELAKSMRKIISGVVKHGDEAEEDIPASVDSGISRMPRTETPEASEQIAGQLSIDDVLLAMGDQGKRITDVVLGAEEQEKDSAAQKDELKEAQGTEMPSGEAEVPKKADTDKEETVPLPEEAEEDTASERMGKSVAEAAADELTESQREALQYTNNPEKLLRNKSSLPTYMEEPKPEDLGKTRRIGDSREELMEAVRQDILSGKTRRIPTEEISRRTDGELPGEAKEAKETPDGVQELPDETRETPDGAQTLPQDEDPGDAYDEGQPEAAEELTADYEEAYDDEYLSIPQYMRGLFSGFTEVEGLEDQIANAILQTEAKGDDKTSRSGNILIFGAHGSGKTTLAMNLAKAIAQDKGSQTVKMARIYAADLNRKDIAATIAKIAGGTLIIEEAGDLEPNTVEQLTTAMEFRTDGLIVILEDEQQYIHEMLMRHPRFTMKFTAQIYLPEYTVEELAVFGRIYANAQDYVIGEEAYDVFCQKIAAGNPDGSPMTISGVTEIVSKAIARSGKFFRKISMGKKRYDENDFVILFPKDFK